MALAGLERQILALQFANKETENKRREQEIECDRLRGDMQILAEKERGAHEALEHEQEHRENEKVSSLLCILRSVNTL